MRDAVERARPQAGVVPEMPRDAACAVRARARSGMERPPDRPAAGTRRARLAATASCRLSMDRGATRCAPAAAPPQASPRAHSSLPRHPQVGSRRPLRGAGAAGGRTAHRPVPCDGACHAHRNNGGPRCRRAGACGALRAADRQPIGVVEQGGGVRRHLVGRARQRHRVVHGCCQRGGAYQLADRPAGRGLRTSPA
jgi:hypothetical protein